MTVKNQSGASLTNLVDVMNQLLSPTGCPWDREQSLASIRKYVIEEAHEVVDAIDGLGADAPRLQHENVTATASSPAVAALKEELGDLLLQVVFQSAIAEKREWFNIDAVVAGIVSKMIRRHPHVFGETKLENSREVLAQWESLKSSESPKRGTLDGLPRTLPRLLQAFRLGEKASNVGFDWQEAHGPRQALDAELKELDDAIATGDRDAMAHELGDVLFSVVNVARKQKLDPDDCLRLANERFRSRFENMEQSLRAREVNIQDCSSEQLDAEWNAAKQRLQSVSQSKPSS